METEIMTQREAVTVADMLRRERDRALEETAHERAWRRFRESQEVLEALLAKQTMWRPGIQNGLKKLEKMN